MNTSCRVRLSRLRPITWTPPSSTKRSGFMSAMTMPYKVREAKEYASLVPGDLDQRHARRRQQRRLPEGRQEGRQRAARKTAGRSGDAAGVVGLRTAETRPAGARAANSSTRTGSRHPRRVSRLGRVCHVHLHEVPDADVLSADGSALRHDSGQAEGRQERAERASADASASIPSRIRPPC